MPRREPKTDPLAELTRRHVALREAMRVVHKAIRSDEHGEYRTARAWLDRRDIFHDDLSGLRVVEAVCAESLREDRQ